MLAVRTSGRRRSSVTRCRARTISLAGCPPGPASPSPSGGQFDLPPAMAFPIEDLGIPGIPYEMTKDDLMKSNKDLLAFCARLLGGSNQ